MRKTLVWTLWNVGASGYLLPSSPLLAPQLSQQLYHFLCDLSQVSSYLSTSIFSSVKWEY